MHTLTFDPHRWWMARVVGRNPLLRRTDRLEMVAVVVAIVLSLTTIRSPGRSERRCLTANIAGTSSRLTPGIGSRRPSPRTATQRAPWR